MTIAVLFAILVLLSFQKFVFLVIGVAIGLFLSPKLTSQKDKVSMYFKMLVDKFRGGKR